MPHHGDGPIPARIMLVGEAWGDDEEREGRPFVGASGQELNRMLQEAGILRSECFVTNVVNHRPPGRAEGRPVHNDISAWIPTRKKDIGPRFVNLWDKRVDPIVAQGLEALRAEINLVKPNLIVAFGGTPLWALTGKTGIMNWRGSHLQVDSEIAAYQPKLIPTVHPAAVLREWRLRAAVINDLKRAARNLDSLVYAPPKYDFIVRPSFPAVIKCLSGLYDRLVAGVNTWLDFDIETRSGHIECFSLSWSRTEAICIPIMSYDGRDGYWNEEEETAIIYLSYKIMTHPRCKVRAQNGLYDVQYTHRWWLFVPNIAQDTMISQHSIFADQPKALHYQASVYADWYIYWKEEGKTWNPKMAPEQRWNYNCLDCVYTREVGEVEQQIVEKLGLGAVHDAQQQMFWPVLKAMTTGIRVLEGNAARLAEEIQEQITIRENFLKDVLGMTINPRSSIQMQALFYQDFNQPIIMSRPKKGAPSRPTCDDEALTKIGNREPLLRPLTSCIADIRTLEKFLSDFVMAKRDIDGRMRCSFNIGGSESGKSAPKTFRLSSSENAFGSGCNLQTIPSEKSKSVGKWQQRQHFSMIGDPYSLPNLRSMFGPDEGKTFFDIDLDRADLHVFVWEIQDELYKQLLQSGVDAHLFHVYLLDGKEPPPLEELVETHPKYPDHRGPRKHKREFSKVFCHATDYVGSSRTIAAATGRTVHETDIAKKKYLGAHPKIEPYWRALGEQVRKRGFVENKFGYRWYVFDRLDMILPELVAWVPQSTVSIVINRIWQNLYNNASFIDVLLQVHDSLAGQFPTNRKDESVNTIKEQSRIIVPYADPLIIPTGIGTSEMSWGAC